jgi:predicted dehydrogenase
MDRREFLTTSTAAGLALAEAASAPAAGRKKYRVGLIGCGWYGLVDLRHLMNVGQVEVVALCDVNKRHLQAAADELAKERKQHPQKFADFRDMLKPKNLDIVLVGTPDHWHALAAIAAMKAGADVYVEKPISHTFLEGSAMVQTARKLKRVVQVNTQRRSTPHFQSAREFIKEGKLGHIGQVRAFCYYHMRANPGPPNQAPPKYLNYDLWAGPAPKIPYNPLLEDRGWRNFNEYSNGILGDMGIHMLDAMRWVLGVKYPKRISSSGGIYQARKSKANITDSQTVTYDYGDFTAFWEHRTWGRPEHPDVWWGLNFYGDKGTLQLTLYAWDFRPLGNGKPVHVKAKVEPDIDEKKYEAKHIYPAGRAHMKNFLDCVASRERPVADIEEGHMSTALCELGNLSQKLGRSLTWDARKEQVVGDEEANKGLRRKYREPWEYPTA